MPIMSFSVSESLKEFLRKLVKSKPSTYKNNSVVMRDALSRLRNSTEAELMGSELIEEIESTERPMESTVVGNIMIVTETHNDTIERKLAKLENAMTSIRGKHCFFYKEDKTIVYILEDTLINIHAFITELNQIENLKNIRYLMV
jgi:Arc/MetJ-type ribon-helix-helix transcriptional regulator